MTTLALTDHDAIAGVAEAEEAARAARDRAGAGDRDVLRARVRGRPAHLRLLDRPGEDRRRPASGPSTSGVTRAGEIVEKLRARGLRPAPRGRGPRGRRRLLDRPPPHRPRRRRDRRPRPLLRGVPGARRQGLRPPPLADRRAGDRADPRRRRRRRHRPPLLGHLRAGRGRRPDPLARAPTASRPTTRPTPRSRPNTSSSSATSSTSSPPPAPTTTAPPTRPSPSSAPTTPTASASRRCRLGRSLAVQATSATLSRQAHPLDEIRPADRPGRPVPQIMPCRSRPACGSRRMIQALIGLLDGIRDRPSGDDQQVPRQSHFNRHPSRKVSVFVP